MRTGALMLVLALFSSLTVTFDAHSQGGYAKAPAQTPAPQPKLDVPYVPTPPEVVTAMLKLAEVKNTDVVYDLGCGDGRIVVAAARDYGARGVGVDIDPARIQEAQTNAQKAGVADRVQFRQQDLFQTNLSEATVVTLYLLPNINLRLRPKLWRELKPGTRVVSHSFDMGDWKPDKVIEVNGRKIYFWVIPPNANRQSHN
jgi:precorrin-6B methylase 2